MTCASLLLTACRVLQADLNDGIFVWGTSVWLVPWAAFLSMGLFAVMGMALARRQSLLVRPLLLLAATVSALLQYAVIMLDLDQYPDAFAWYEAFLIPYHLILIRESWSSLGTVFGLVVPSIGILLVTGYLPLEWRRYRAAVRAAADATARAGTSGTDETAP